MTYRALDDGTTWPFDIPKGDEPCVQWRLRYGSPTRADQLLAASILAAYDALLSDGTAATQTVRLRELRRLHAATVPKAAS